MGESKTFVVKTNDFKTSNEVAERITHLYEEFIFEHGRDSKASAKRARVAIGELKKLITEYRKLSVEENK